MENSPIGVFDSGVGGLSVLIELKKLLPNENFVFLADQKYVPYGEKSKKELLRLMDKATDYFVKAHNVKMMVIACNTATCYTIEQLRAKHSFPIIGTLPAVKPAARETKTGTIAVISTPATSKSPALKQRIKEYCKGIKVINIGCKNLEDVVEQGELDGKHALDLLNKYLTKVKNSNADYLVLGCTHYPFLKKSIQKIVGPKVRLIDTGLPIAKKTKSLVSSMKNKQNKTGRTIYFTTGDSSKFSKVASKLLNKKIQSKTVKI